VVWNDEKMKNRRKCKVFLRRKMGLIGTVVDLLTYNEAELREATSDESSFTSKIIKEGVVIYAR